VSRRATWLAVAACVTVGAVVRAIPCRGDFWLDEIWTWGDALRLHSPLEVFTRIHHSNNHYLNTLLFYWLGDQRDWAVYRLPSLAAGIATIALGAWLGARRGRLEAVLTAGLLAASFPLVHFSSEARGYSLAVCFALGALLALLRFFERGRAIDAVLFSACAVLGLLAQLTSVFFWAGALALSALHVWRQPAPRTRALRAALLLHAAPALALLVLWWVDLRHLRVGGGPPAVAAQVVARSVGYSLGLPVRDALAPLYAALALSILALGLRRLWRDRDDLWLLLLVAIALAPAAILVALRPAVIDLRYFLIGTALALVLLAWILAAGLRARGWRRAAAGLAIAVFLVGNGHSVARFLALGRGGYGAALRFMADHSDGERIVVGSDHDFRNERTLRFYARFLPAGKRLEYRPRDAWPPGGPEWYLLHRQARPRAPSSELLLPGAGRYRLAAEFDHAAISGFYWAIYRRMETGSGAGAGSPRRRRRIRSPKPSRPNGSGPIATTRA
jgi:hypothetical protein